MSPDHESSYYEIALTNRQVLTIFVVLLTCLVAAFLSGVWIGRRDGAEGLLAASAGEPPAEPAKAQMAELNFFSEAPPLGSRGEAPPPKRPPATVPEPPAATAVAETPVRAEKPPPAAPAPASAAGQVIQVFSTLDEAQADRLVRRLGDGGYPVFLLEESLQGRTTYRVRVGPYPQRDQAQRIADELRREYRLETWITSQPG